MPTSRLHVILTTVPSDYAHLALHGLEYLYAAVTDTKLADCDLIYPDKLDIRNVEDLGDVICKKTQNSTKILLCLSVPFETLEPSRRLVNSMRTRLNEKEVDVVVGGLWPTASGSNALNFFPEADYTVRGYGEKPLQDILKYGKAKTIDNVVTRAQGGEILQGKSKYVGFGDVFLPRRINYFIEIENIRLAPMNFFRECAGHCSFCIKDLFVFDGSTKNLNLKPGKVIAKEIDLLHREGVTRINGIDNDALGINPRDWFPILEEIEKSGLYGIMKVYLETRVENIVNYPELMRQMRSFGLSHMFMGMESLVTSQLERYNKLYTMDGKTTGEEYRSHVRKAIGILRKNRIFFTLGTISIDAEMTFSEYEEYIRLIKQNKIYHYMSDFTKPIYIYPGTSIYRLYKNRGLLKTTNEDMNELNPPYYFKDLKIEMLVNFFRLFRDSIPADDRRQFQHIAWYKAIFDDPKRIRRIQTVEHRMKDIKIKMAETVMSMISQGVPFKEIESAVIDSAQESFQLIRDSGLVLNARQYPKHM